MPTTPSHIGRGLHRFKHLDNFLVMAKQFQPIGAEVEGNLKLLELQLENVEGGKMEVALIFFTYLIVNRQMI